MTGMIRLRSPRNRALRVVSQSQLIYDNGLSKEKNSILKWGEVEEESDSLDFFF